MTATRLGIVLIVIGVCVWVAYAALRFFVGYEGSVMPFLVVHLLCVVPGAFLSGRGWTKRLIEMAGGGRRDDVRNG